MEARGCHLLDFFRGPSHGSDGDAFRVERVCIGDQRQCFGGTALESHSDHVEKQKDGVRQPCCNNILVVAGHELVFGNS